LKTADVVEGPQSACGVDGMGVRALHVTEPSTCEVGGGCDIDDDERSAAIDPAFIETLEAFLAELPLAECRDEDMGHVAAGPDSMPSQVVVGTISTETLTDVHGLPRVCTRATQTPRSAELYLPLSKKQLVQLVRESNGDSVAAMMHQLRIRHGGIRNDETQILMLVLDAMVEARRDLISTVLERYEAARKAMVAAPGDDGVRKINELKTMLESEYRRPRPNPWPRTSTEVDEELIHVVTPGFAATINAEDAAAEVILIDCD
jgi:hypothetical protein